MNFGCRLIAAESSSTACARRAAVCGGDADGWARARASSRRASARSWSVVEDELGLADRLVGLAELEAGLAEQEADVGLRRVPAEGLGVGVGDVAGPPLRGVEPGPEERADGRVLGDLVDLVGDRRRPGHVAAAEGQVAVFLEEDDLVGELGPELLDQRRRPSRSSARSRSRSLASPARTAWIETTRTSDGGEAGLLGVLRDQLAEGRSRRRGSPSVRGRPRRAAGGMAPFGSSFASDST